MDWKSVSNIGLIQWILILGVNLQVCAQNLVSNPSFEEYDDCPFLPGQIEEAIGWKNLNGSCDYYHECGANGYGVPVSLAGGGAARTGNAYGQFGTYSSSITDGREFFESELMEPLVFGIPYRVIFFLSLQDSLNYAVRNVGAHFSDQPHSQNLNDLLALEPQVSYTDTAFLDDKIRWMLVEGTFTANGGERYMAIGNFDDDANTDTISVANGGSLVNHPPGYWDVAGYFIDDVSVIPDSIYLDVENVESQSELTLYPNPNQGTFTVQLPLAATQEAIMEVWSVSGQLVHTERLYAGSNPLHLQVADGLYLYRVMVNREPKWLGKISVGSE